MTGWRTHANGAIRSLPGDEVLCAVRSLNPFGSWNWFRRDLLHDAEVFYSNGYFDAEHAMAGADADVAREAEVLEPFRAQLDDTWRVTIRHCNGNSGDWQVDGHHAPLPGSDPQLLELGVRTIVPARATALEVEDLAHGFARAALDALGEEIFRSYVRTSNET